MGLSLEVKGASIQFKLMGDEITSYQFSLKAPNAEYAKSDEDERYLVITMDILRMVGEKKEALALIRQWAATEYHDEHYYHSVKVMDTHQGVLVRAVTFPDAYIHRCEEKINPDTGQGTLTLLLMQKPDKLESMLIESFSDTPVQETISSNNAAPIVPTKNAEKPATQRETEKVVLIGNRTKKLDNVGENGRDKWVDENGKRYYPVKCNWVSESDFSKLRQHAVRKAWRNEKKLAEEDKLAETMNLAKKKKSTTRDWGDEEIKELLGTKGKVTGYEGQHMISAKEVPDYAGCPNNIQFLKGRNLTPNEHIEAHGGNYGNPTFGYYCPNDKKITLVFKGHPYIPSKGSQCLYNRKAGDGCPYNTESGKNNCPYETLNGKGCPNGLPNDKAQTCNPPKDGCSYTSAKK